MFLFLSEFGNQRGVIRLFPELAVSMDYARKRNAIAVVSIQSDGAIQKSVANHMKEQFGCTSAEAQVCEELKKGNSIQEIADIRSVSIETVRTQVKCVFQKTGVKSQAKLVALLSRI